MFVLSPAVATTRRRPARSRPRAGASDSIPCPTTKPPFQPSPEARERLLVLVDGGDVPAVLRELERDRGADAPTSDHDCLHARSVTDTDAVMTLSSKTPSREGDDQHLAGALRRTWSTVGEKKRDWRRQRGDEPSTIRSASVSRASSTIAWPIERARTVRVTISTPLSSPSARASASDVGAHAGRRPRAAPLERERARHARSRTGPRPWRPAPCASVIAVATISSPMSPSFIGTRILLEARARGGSCAIGSTSVEHARPRAGAGRRRRRRARRGARPGRRSGRPDA